MIMLIGARRRPRIVDAVDDDAGFAFCRQLPGHSTAHKIHACLDQRWHVRLPRLDVRRQEEARPGFALLMYVVDDLRSPDILNLVYRELRLDLRESVPVAVVVVTCVMMIKLR